MALTIHTCAFVACLVLVLLVLLAVELRFYSRMGLPARRTTMLVLVTIPLCVAVIAVSSVYDVVTVTAAAPHQPIPKGSP